MTTQRKRKRLPKVFQEAMGRDEILDYLVTLSPIDYDKERKPAAKKLGCSVLALDEEVKLIKKKRDEQEEAENVTKNFLPEIEPWPELVSGDELIKELVKQINRYCVLPQSGDIALALWIMHAHAHDAAQTSPLLALVSPVPGCGKTTALMFIEKLTPRAIRVDNLTTAVVYRLIEDFKSTLLIDEADAFLKGKEELRGVLDSGHRRGGMVLRLVGDDHTPQPFSTWAPKAIGLIGRLPPTLADRSITIPMQRLLSGQNVKRLRVDQNPFDELRRKIACWVLKNMEELSQAKPRMPKELVNARARDNWRPLFAIAEHLGVEWKRQAHKAALNLSKSAASETAEIMLLTDIHRWFARDQNRDYFVTTDMCDMLAKRTDRPWGEYSRGKPITPHAVGQLLGKFNIKSGRVSHPTTNLKVRGYKKIEFEETFERYIPSRPRLERSKR